MGVEKVHTEQAENPLKTVEKVATILGVPKLLEASEVAEEPTVAVVAAEAAEDTLAVEVEIILHQAVVEEDLIAPAPTNTVNPSVTEILDMEKLLLNSNKQLDLVF